MLKYLESQFYYPFSLSAGAFKEITESLATCGGLILWDKTKPNSESESKRKPFGTVPGNFSEYQYFLPHVRQLLFKGDDPALRVFEVDPKAIEGWSIVVKIPPRVGTAPLERRARLRWVMVMIYDLDVAVLSFAVRWDRGVDRTDANDWTLDDAVDVNNLVRRSSPSMLDPELEERSSENGYSIEDSSRFQKEQRELAHGIWFENESGRIVDSFEDFGSVFDAWLMKHDPESSYRARHVGYWLPREKDGHGAWTPILDSRNFVSSLIVVDPDDLNVPDSSAEESGPVSLPIPFEHRQRLYQMLMPHTSPSTPNASYRLRDDLLRRSIIEGTGYPYYGFTGNSAFCVTCKEQERKRTRSEFNSIWFQIANLILVRRSALLALSRRCAEVTHPPRISRGREGNDLERAVETLRTDFVRFNDRYWFCQVTGDEEGQRRFEFWDRRMGNERIFEEVREEIEALHEFGQVMMNRRLANLTYLNFVVVSLMVVTIVTTALHVDFGFRDLAFAILLGVLGLACAAVSLTQARRFVERVLNPLLGKHDAEMR